MSARTAIIGRRSPRNITPRPALDFFAGCGLAAEALRPFFSIVWSNDICPKKAATYIANHPSDRFQLGDIAEVQGSKLPAACLSWASFPCQDLSLAGNLKGLDSLRSGLVWQWLRVMDEMPTRPPILVAENVVGFLSGAGGSHYLAVHDALRSRGYRVGAVILDAIHWLPQSRPRVFVIAVAAGQDTKSYEARQGIWCHNAAVRRVAALADDFVWWSLPYPGVKPKPLDSIVEFTAETHPPQLSQSNLRLISQTHRQRMQASVNGHQTVFPGYKRTRNGRQVLELRFDNVAGCLRTPQGGSSRQLLVIYRDGKFQTRLLTVKEASRLMGVRKNYRIEGSYNDGYKAMGDAVAIPAVRHLARHLLAPLAKDWRL